MATCVERSGERLAALCLRRLCCVSSAWPPWLGWGARARRLRPAATRPWLKLVFGPYCANFSTAFWLTVATGPQSTCMQRFSSEVGAGAHRDTTKSPPLTNRLKCGCSRCELKSTNEPSGAAPSRPPARLQPKTANVRGPPSRGKQKAKSLRAQVRAAAAKGCPAPGDSTKKRPPRDAPTVDRRGAAGVSITRARPEPGSRGRPRSPPHPLNQKRWPKEPRWCP